MRSYIPAYIILLVIALPANSQYTISMEAGFDKSQLHTNITGIPYTKNQSEFGFVLNTLVTLKIQNRLFLKTGINYLQKNYSYQRTGPYKGIYTTFLNSYLQLPLITGVEYGNKKIKGFVQAGVYGAYWIHGKTKGRIPDIYHITDSIDNTGQIIETFQLTSFNQKYNFDSRKDKRLELGWVTGLGVHYYLNKRSSLIMETNYFGSFTDQQKNYMSNQKARHNQTITMTLGYMYHLNQNSRSR